MNVANQQEPLANNIEGNNNNNAGNQGGGYHGGDPAPPVLQNVIVPPPAMIFVDDPFKGNINPGTSDGAKLWLGRISSKYSGG